MACGIPKKTRALPSRRVRRTLGGLPQGNQTFRSHTRAALWRGPCSAILWTAEGTLDGGYEATGELTSGREPSGADATRTLNRTAAYTRAIRSGAQTRGDSESHDPSHGRVLRTRL